MPGDLHDFESDDAADLDTGRRHPFDSHMVTAPMWVKVVSRTGFAVWVAGWIVIALGAIGVGRSFGMTATGIYLSGFGLVVSVVSMAFHPRKRRH